MPLFHFSEHPDIGFFAPRSVAVASERPPGMDWLNGPLVWAIDDWHQPLYLFPRECPRIIVWPGHETTPSDRARWWGDRTCRMIAHIEWTWLERLRVGKLFRYELPEASFQPLNDAGMYVSRSVVEPRAMEPVFDLLTALRQHDVELRVMQSLTPLRDLWFTSLRASGIRLRNASDW